MNHKHLLETLLERLDFKTEQEKQDFLKADYDSGVLDPFLLDGMKVTTERLNRALELNEKVAIYADFDADGIPGAVVLHDFFKKIGFFNFTVYIPHRDKEGYGMHPHAIEKLKDEGVNLIVTVDVGISSLEALRRASELGVDVIITDHHEPNGEIEEMEKLAVSIINPKKKNDKYPFKHLCGAGVAFKLIQAMLQYGRANKKQWVLNVVDGWEKWLLDVVAIATISDMVPLLGENRVLAKWGLVVLRKTKRPGILALARKTGFKLAQANEDDIGFSIAPRINAASRMDTPELAFKLLATDSPKEAEDLSSELEKLNRARKAKVAAMSRKIKKKISNLEKLPDVVVTGSPDYSPALCGLVANSLAEEFSRPVCVWGREGNGTYKGSCRSDGSISVFDLFEAVKDKLLFYGGHKEAGGFAVSLENIHTLQDEFCKAYKRLPKAEKDETQEPIVISLSDANTELLKALEVMRPFGIGNPKPVFLFKELHVEKISAFGKEKQHTEIFVKEKNERKRAFAFFSPVEKCPVKDKISLCATVEYSFWKRQVELKIVSVS